MNKNIIKLFAIVMMIFMIGAVLVSCGGGTKGDKGDTGAQGLPGVQGEKGDQGIAGLTPYIKDGNWWIGDTDLGVKAEAEDLTDCTNHNYVYREWPDERHTMTSEGVALGVCSNCGDAVWETIGHEWVKGTPVAPTCIAEGYTPYTCYCGAVEHREIVAKVACVPGDKVYAINDAGICDCEWTNAWWINCEVCGTRLSEGADGKKDHSWTVKEPIIPELGSNLCDFKEGYRWVCDNCDCADHIKYEYTGAVRGHAAEEFDPDLTKFNGDKVTLTYVCDNCNMPQSTVVSLESCKKVTPATCTKDGSVTYVYNYKVDGKDASIEILPAEVLPATNHAHTEVVEGKDASCGLPGLTDGKKCTDCGEMVVEQVVIPAVGHNHGESQHGSSKDWPEIIKVDGNYYKAYWCDVCKNWVAYELLVNYVEN